jgi:hypothetical protein
LSKHGFIFFVKLFVFLVTIPYLLLLEHRYPYNNFLHHHVENIIISCLEGKRTELVEHVLNDCDLVGKILVAERLSSLSTDSNGVSH